MSLDRCEAYRHFAAQCVELARHIDGPQNRAVLLEMALLWSRLAELARRRWLSKPLRRQPIKHQWTSVLAKHQRDCVPQSCEAPFTIRCC
jgi:hypothetical protein